MHYPKISIIIVSYNSGDTLEHCLFSVINQSYVNKELIFIDGGSTDNSINIIKKYKTQITYSCSEPDNGIYDAMNKGILKSTGDWLYFLGADDTLYDDHVLSAIFKNQDTEHFDFIYGNVYVEHFKAIYDGEYDFDKFACQPLNHQAAFFRRRLFEKYGLYDLKFKALADNHFISKFFFNKKILRFYIPLIIANYSFGGYSSITADEKYNYDKPYLVIKYGKGAVSKKVLVDNGYRQAVYINLKFKKYHIAIIEWFRYFFYAIFSGNLIYFIKKDINKILKLV